jgi:basic membrane protein A
LRKVRRAPFIAVLALLALIVAACGSSNNTSSGTTTGGGGTTTTGGQAGKGKKVGLVYDIGGRGDKSFNDSAAAGLDQAKKDFGIDAKDLSPSSGGENREELLRLLTTDGYGLVFGIGFNFADGVTKVSQESPETKYGIIDAVVDQPNVASLTFAEEQGSYLVGAAAALKSKTGHIGFVGGVDTDLIHKFQAGYEAGAKKIKPDIKIDVKYLTVPPDFGGFSDPAKGKEAALGMYSAGADIVYHAAGGSGSGVFQAAKDSSAGGTKVWAIGVDSDQYQSIGDPSLQPYILTSMIKKVNVAVYETIKDYVNGDLKTGNDRVFDLKSGGIDYATSGGFIDDIKSQIDDLKQQIIDGKITVPTK